LIQRNRYVDILRKAARLSRSQANHSHQLPTPTPTPTANNTVPTLPLAPATAPLTAAQPVAFVPFPAVTLTLPFTIPSGTHGVRVTLGFTAINPVSVAVAVVVVVGAAVLVVETDVTMLQRELQVVSSASASCFAHAFRAQLWVCERRLGERHAQLKSVREHREVEKEEARQA